MPKTFAMTSLALLAFLAALTAVSSEPTNPVDYINPVIGNMHKNAAAVRFPALISHLDWSN